jgi:ABC-type transport system involved in cytochrome bd biosynthesis fused ATPase/permease subunit
MNASRDEVNRAIREASLGQLSAQLEDQPIGENGKKLSGGQKQRISIARAVLRIIKGAAILIADEPTSALDEPTGQEIIQQIFSLVKTMYVTALIVTHDFKIIVDETNVDEVIVIEEGKIVDKGTVSHLISKKGFFAQRLQQAKSAIAAPLEEKKEKCSDLRLDESDSSEMPSQVVVARSIQGSDDEDDESVTRDESHRPLLTGFRRS